MAQQCPECRTIVDDEFDRCGSCGCRLSGEKIRQRWEESILRWIGIVVAIGLLTLAVWFLRR